MNLYIIIKIAPLLLYTILSCGLAVEELKCIGIPLNTNGVVKCANKRHVKVENAWISKSSCGLSSQKTQMLTNLISSCTNNSYCEIPFYSNKLHNVYLNVKFQCEDADVTCFSLRPTTKKQINCNPGHIILIDEAWVDQTECPLRKFSAGHDVTANVANICSGQETCHLQFLGTNTNRVNIYYHCKDVTHKALSSKTTMPQRHKGTSTTNFHEISSKDGDATHGIHRLTIKPLKRRTSTVTIPFHERSSKESSTVGMGQTSQTVVSTSTAVIEISSDYKGLTITTDSAFKSTGHYVNTFLASVTISAEIQQNTKHNESTETRSREVSNSYSIALGGVIAGSILGILILLASIVVYINYRKRRVNSNDKTYIATKYEPNYCEPWDIKSEPPNCENSQEQNEITFIEVKTGNSTPELSKSSNGNDYSTIQLDYDHIRKTKVETGAMDDTENTDDNVYSHLREVDVESDVYDHIVRQSSSIRRNIEGNYSFLFRNRRDDGYDNMTFSSV